VGIICALRTTTRTSAELATSSQEMSGNPELTSTADATRELLGTYPFMQYTDHAASEWRVISSHLLPRLIPWDASVASHLSPLCVTLPEIPTLEMQHPEHAQDFARLSNPVTEADHAFRDANIREVERLMTLYAPGIGGGASYGNDRAGTFLPNLFSGM
jgi:hypothetical protein